MCSHQTTDDTYLKLSGSETRKKCHALLNIKAVNAGCSSLLYSNGITNKKMYFLLSPLRCAGLWCKT